MESTSVINIQSDFTLPFRDPHNIYSKMLVRSRNLFYVKQVIQIHKLKIVRNYQIWVTWFPQVLHSTK
jgi:hypothetical protein